MWPHVLRNGSFSHSHVPVSRKARQNGQGLGRCTGWQEGGGAGAAAGEPAGEVAVQVGWPEVLVKTAGRASTHPLLNCRVWREWRGQRTLKEAATPHPYTQTLRGIATSNANTQSRSVQAGCAGQLDASHRQASPCAGLEHPGRGRASGRARRSEAVCACDTLLLRRLAGWRTVRLASERSVRRAPPRPGESDPVGVSCAARDCRD